MLCDFKVMHYFFPSAFVSIHDILCDTLTSSWNISMGNRTKISSKLCRLCHIAVCREEFYANFLLIEYGIFDIMLGVDC